MLKNLCACLSVYFLSVAAVVAGEGSGHADGTLLFSEEAFVVRDYQLELPQRSVRAVLIDQRGRLWAGTREGLVREYGGKQTVWIQSQDGPPGSKAIGIPDGKVNAIYEDAWGGIWIGTSRGVSYVPPMTDDPLVMALSDFDDRKPLDVMAFAEFQGMVFAATFNGDIVELSPSRVNRLELDLPQGLSDGPINYTSLAAYGDSLYAGTSDHGVFAFKRNGAGLQAEAEPLVDGRVVGIEFRGDDLIWLDLYQGPQATSLSTMQTVALSPEVKAEWKSVAVRDDGVIWVGGSNRVFKYDENGFSSVAIPNKVNVARDLYVDSVGHVWAGTLYGLKYIIDPGFSTIPFGGEGPATALLETKTHTYVAAEHLATADIGTQDYRELDRAANGQLITGWRLGESIVTAIAKKDDVLILGYRNGGFDVVDLQTGAVTQVSSIPPDSQDGVRFESGMSGIRESGPMEWVATMYGYGVIKISVARGEGSPEVELDTVSISSYFNGIYEIAPNHFLATAEGKLASVRKAFDGSFSFQILERSPAQNVLSVAGDGAGGAYIGIEGQGIAHLPLSALEEGVYEPQAVPVAEQHLGSRTVWTLQIEKQGKRLWAGTNNGVYVFNVAQGVLDAHLTVEDGLPSDEFEHGSHTSLTTMDGKTMMVTDQGVAVFRDLKVKAQEDVELVFSDVRLNGVSLFDKIEGKADARFSVTVDHKKLNPGLLEIVYAPMDRVAGSHGDYAFRLNGIVSNTDAPVVGFRDWPYFDPIELTPLMLDTSGQPVSKPVQLRINITSPWYVVNGQSLLGVFIAVAVLVALFAIALQQVNRASRRRLDQAAMQQAAKQAVIQAKLETSETLNREIRHRTMNILSTLSSSVKNMRRRADTDDVKSVLEALEQRITVQSSIHAQLSRSDGTSIDVAILFKQILQSVKAMFEGLDDRPIKLDVPEFQMTYSKAQYLALAINELAVNTYKHTSKSQAGAPAHAALVKTTPQEDGSLLLTYRDFGPGMTDEELEESMSGRPTTVSGGLRQALSLLRELSDETRIYTDEGLVCEVVIPAEYITSSKLSSEDEAA